MRLTLLFLFICTLASARTLPPTQFAIEAEPIEDGVENGQAYEYGKLDLGGVTEIALPADFTVDNVATEADAALTLKKQLRFHGHPPQPVSIKSGRPWMGCAARREGKRLTIATFGEWQSKEGGARLQGRLLLPKRIHLRRDKALGGPQSRAQGKPESMESKDGYWYGPRAPGDGWVPIETFPDARHRFNKD